MNKSSLRRRASVFGVAIAATCSASAQVCNAPGGDPDRSAATPRNEVWHGPPALGPVPNVLFYRDDVIGTCAYEAALASGTLGTVTFTTSATTFADHLIGGQQWDLIVVAHQGGHHLNTFQAALVGYRASDADCGIIISEWSDQSAAQYLPSIGFAHVSPWNVFGAATYTAGGTVDGAPPITFVDAGYYIWDTGTIDGGTTEITGPPGHAMGKRLGNIIVNGFLSDTMSPPENGVELVRRQIVAVTRSPGGGGPTGFHVPADYPTIQAAVDAALDGTTITIAPGVYSPTTITGKWVRLFASDGMEVTTIQGSAASRCVTIGAGADGTLVQGLTLTGGTAATGGCVFVTDAKFVSVQDCALLASTAPAGAAVAVEAGGAVTVADSVIASCVSTGTIVRAGTGPSSVVIRHCDIFGNLVTAAGGALIEAGSGSASPNPADAASALVEVSTVTGNHCGRAVFAATTHDSGVVTVIGSTVERNNFKTSSAKVLATGGNPAGSRCVFTSNSLCGNYPAVLVDAPTQSDNSQSGGCACVGECDIDWADHVVAYSSQYSTGAWSAAQALGLPNTWNYGDITTAWAPCCTTGTHWLEVGFAAPRRSEGCIVRETYAVPFVQQIYAVDVNDTEHLVWPNSGSSVDTVPPGLPSNAHFSWERTGYLTASIRVVVASSGSWEEIDALAVIGETPTADCNENGVLDVTEIAAQPSLDANGNGSVDECECIADMNSDGGVNSIDLAVILADWGSAGSGLRADLNGDGMVGGADLAITLGMWGACP